jgi:type IV secretion system protein VirB6
MASALFAGIAANWDATMSDGVTQTIADELVANATLFGSMLVLYIIISGVLTMFGRISMAEWVFGATRAAILSSLLTAAAFSQYIQVPLMDTIPNWIAQSVNGGMGAQTAPQQFDGLRDAVVAIEAGVLQQATGWTQVGERIRADFATWLICLELTISFIIWEMSRGLMGLLVAVAPFLLGLYLFRATRHIPLNLAGSAVSALILLLLMSVLLNISINADQRWLAQSRTANATIDVQLDNMKNIALFFMFGMVMTAFLPFLASRIGHGVLPGVAPLVTAPLRVGESVGRGGLAAAQRGVKALRG